MLMVATLSKLAVGTVTDPLGPRGEGSGRAGIGIDVADSVVRRVERRRSHRVLIVLDFHCSYSSPDFL